MGVLMVENLSKTIDGEKFWTTFLSLGHDDKVAFVGSNRQAKTTSVTRSLR